MDTMPVIGINWHALLPGLFPYTCSPRLPCYPLDLPRVRSHALGPIQDSKQGAQISHEEVAALRRLVYLSQCMGEWVGVVISRLYTTMGETIVVPESSPPSSSPSPGVALVKVLEAGEWQAFQYAKERYYLLRRWTFGFSEWLAEKLYRLGLPTFIPVVPPIRDFPEEAAPTPRTFRSRDVMIPALARLQDRGWVCLANAGSNPIIFLLPDGVEAVCRSFHQG